VIYLDTSVVLAHVLVEDRRPPPSLWQEALFSSRLLEYEVWVRLNARNLHQSHANVAHALTNRITFVELKPETLERALEPFPVPVRTLDALHLASMAFLLRHGQSVELATYDERLAAAARALSIPIAAI
jgi:predicted nucleic acid-binding protein